MKLRNLLGVYLRQTKIWITKKFLVSKSWLAWNKPDGVFFEAEHQFKEEVVDCGEGSAPEHDRVALARLPGRHLRHKVLKKPMKSQFQLVAE